MNYFKEKKETIDSLVGFLEGKEPYPKYPLGIFIEVSNLCNLQCVMCAEFSSINPARQKNIKNIKRGFIDYNHVLALEEVLKHSLEIYLFGFGESTIYPKFLELITYVSKFQSVTSFYTNGMLLKDELIKCIVDNSVYEITVSFSGATKSDYEDIYHGGSFDQVLNNLENLKKYKEKTGSLFPKVSINSLAFEHHIKKFDKFVELMSGYGVSLIHLMPLQSPGSLKGHSAVLRPGIEGKIIEKAKKIAGKNNIWINDSNFSSMLAGNEDEYNRLKNIQSDINTGEYIDFKKFRTTPIGEFQTIAKKLKSVKIKPQNLLDPEKHFEPEYNSDAGNHAKPEKYSKTGVPIDFEKDTLEQIKKVSGVQKIKPEDRCGFYCLEPFTRMYMTIDGIFKPCCIMPITDLSFGNLESSSCSAIWNGRGYEIFRKSIINDEYPLSLCEWCLKHRTYPPSDTYMQSIWNFLDFTDKACKTELYNKKKLFSNLGRLNAEKNYLVDKNFPKGLPGKNRNVFESTLKQRIFSIFSRSHPGKQISPSLIVDIEEMFQSCKQKLTSSEEFKKIASGLIEKTGDSLRRREIIMVLMSFLIENGKVDLFAELRHYVHKYIKTDFILLNNLVKLELNSNSKKSQIDQETVLKAAGMSNNIFIEPDIEKEICLNLAELKKSQADDYYYYMIKGSLNNLVLPVESEEITGFVDFFDSFTTRKHLYEKALSLASDNISISNIHKKIQNLYSLKI
jgi:MoaA/NifB/PqqE/SkfB family radical SAM enzyme